MTDLYAQYSALEKQIETLELAKKELRATIEEQLPEEGVKNEFVTAFWTLKKKWTYSPMIDALTDNLKVAKKTEEETGMATAEEVKQLTIKVQ